jgi:N-methylhydantoinase B/oxoprolinase/acetone carboxylase alpha subunit
VRPPGHEDGLLRASVAVTVQGGRLTLDFSGTSPEHEGSYNAFTHVIRGHCAVGLCQFPFHDFPISSGMFDHIDIRVPHGSFFDADPQAVIADLRADIITDWTAREVFGVVYDSETLLIDESATRALRQEHRDRRLANACPYERARCCARMALAI